MTRRRALAAVAAAALATRAAAFELTPQNEYGAAWTFLGAAGGGALGAALGGLTRAAGASRVKPFLRWGAAGSLFGGALGRDIGRDALARARADETVAPAPTREAAALLGSLAGELVGFGAGALVAHSTDRGGREIWAGISLGAVLGAAAGLLVSPPGFLAPPSSHADPRREFESAGARVEPALGTPDDAAALARDAEARRLAAGRYAPAALPARTRALGDALLDPESERLVQERALPALRHAPAPMILPALAPDPKLAALGRSVLTLGLLEGAVLGAAGAAATGGDAAFAGRLGVGAAVGALAGWSAIAALTRPWTDRSEGWNDPGTGWEQGRRTGAILVGGMLGSLLGVAAGASIRNADRSFTRSDVGISAVAGNLTGLLAATLLTSPRPPRVN